MDGIPPEGRKIKASLDPANATTVTVTCGTANYVCEHGPPMDMWSLQLDPKSNHSFYPYGAMDDDKYSHANGGHQNAIMMFNSTQLPIKTAVAENFVSTQAAILGSIKPNLARRRRAALSQKGVSWISFDEPL